MIKKIKGRYLTIYGFAISTVLKVVFSNNQSDNAKTE